MTKQKRRIEKIVNSYLLAHKDNPYEKLKLLQKYMKAKNIADIDIRKLKKVVDRQLKSEQNNKRLEKIEAKLFTKEGEPKKNKFGSAFCKRCQMYKDYEKECPYCGSLEMTI